MKHHKVLRIPRDFNTDLKKLASTGSESARMGLKSILSLEFAIFVSALTAVNLVISFLSRSWKMGKHSGSWGWMQSPRCAMIWPMQEMARSFTS